MASAESNYRNEQMEKYNNITESYLEKLPYYVRTYVNSKMDRLSFRTRAGYVQDLSVFFYWLSGQECCKDVEMKNIPLETLDALNADDIDEYSAFLTQYEGPDGVKYVNSAAGKSRKLSSLRSLYLFLNKRGKLSHNPASLVENPKIPQKDVRVLSVEERDKIFDAILNGVSESDKGKEIHEVLAKRDFAIYMLFLGSGLRISELVGIDLDDINFQEGRINVVRKGAKFSHIYVNQDVLYAIEDYVDNCRSRLEPSDKDYYALFISRKHNRMSVRSVEVMIKKYTDALYGSKHGITPHKLRATYGTQLMEDTGDILLVANALNHQSTDVTAKKYIAVKEESLKRAKDVKMFGE